MALEARSTEWIAAAMLKEVLELPRTIWYNNSLLSKIFLKMDFFRL